MALTRMFPKSAGRCFHQTDVGSVVRHFSDTDVRNGSYKLVIVGGGTGGCATAARFCRELGRGHVAVIEPSQTHVYQSMWTLVGAGLKNMKQSKRPMSAVLPADCDWIADSAMAFNPENNSLITASGKLVTYEYLVVATGLQLNYGQVKGLKEALQRDPQVCSNYHPSYVLKTFPALEATQSGNAIFTVPNTPIKCAGAPQKIMYLGEEIFRKNGTRDRINVIYNTALEIIFTVKKYASSLLKIIDERKIWVNYGHNLVEVNHETREAIFQLQNSDKGAVKSFQYDFLHVTPPMSAPDVIRASPLVNSDGWVDVNKHTLQHNKFHNVFALGDCTSLPTSKTAAAAATQSGIVKQNLSAVMSGKPPPRSYDGYTSCPLVTGKNKCILAEFDYDGQPKETFPIDQSIERWSMYQLKAHIMPKIYFHGVLKGRYRGPAIARKVLHAGMDHRRK